MRRWIPFVLATLLGGAHLAGCAAHTVVPQAGSMSPGGEAGDLAGKGGTRQGPALRRSGEICELSRHGEFALVELTPVRYRVAATFGYHQRVGRADLLEHLRDVRQTRAERAEFEPSIGQLYPVLIVATLDLDDARIEGVAAAASAAGFADIEICREVRSTSG